MAAKGATKDCCCGGCGEVPWDTRILDPQFVQELQQFCAGCIPRQLCVSYRKGGVNVHSTLVNTILPCDLDGETTKVHYRGNVIVEGAIHEVELHFLVESGRCYLQLRAYTLGISGNEAGHRLEITDAVRAVLSPKCQSCPDAIYEPCFFEVPVPDTGGGSICIQAAANTSTKPLPRCCECPDLCEDEPYEETPPPCGPPCGNCGCICTTACIIVIRDNVVLSDELVSICRNRYRTSSGITITLGKVSEQDECCQLSLSSDGYVTIATNPGSVRVGTLTNPCPTPSARWEFLDDEGKLVIVSFDCASCGGECVGLVVEPDRCCGPEAAILPRVLQADIDGGALCCGRFQLMLVWDSTQGAWIGRSEDAMCGHHVEIALNCGPVWTLGFDASGCAQTGAEAAMGSTCTPVNLVFTLSTLGVGCCGGVDQVDSTLTLTITE